MEINESFTVNASNNQTEDLDYETYDLWEHHGSTFSTAMLVFVILLVALLVCDVILLLTCLCPAARKKSASWYLYHLGALTIFCGILVIPSEYLEINCKLSFLLSRIVGCVRGINIILINIEIIATILAPRASWEKNPKFRFLCSLGTVWTFSVIFMGILLVAADISYSDFTTNCNIHSMYVTVLLHVLKNWIPGIILIVFTIAAIVIYNRARRDGSYAQIIENTGECINRREWLVCLVVLNCLYVLLDLLLYEIHVDIVGGVMLDLNLLVLTNWVVFVMPLSMLGLDVVRRTLKEGAIRCCFLVRRKRENNNSPQDSTQNVIFDLGNMDSEPQQV